MNLFARWKSIKANNSTILHCLIQYHGAVYPHACGKPLAAKTTPEYYR